MYLYIYIYMYIAYFWVIVYLSVYICTNIPSSRHIIYHLWTMGMNIMSDYYYPRYCY